MLLLSIQYICTMLFKSNMIFALKLIPGAPFMLVSAVSVSKVKVN